MCPLFHFDPVSSSDVSVTLLTGKGEFAKCPAEQCYCHTIHFVLFGALCDYLEVVMNGIVFLV